MQEPTRADSYYTTLQGLVGLGSSATAYEQQRVAREKAKRDALEALKQQARADQEIQFNVGVNNAGDPGVSGGSTPGLFGMYPVSNYRISSNYGSRTHPVSGKHSNHTGVDFATKSGSPIYAVADGTVRSTVWDKIYGNQTILDFGGGVSTMYGHQAGYTVKPGQKVKKGQIIGYVGSTGLSTGPHLHFETWVNNKPVNPLSWFAKQ